FNHLVVTDAEIHADDGAGRHPGSGDERAVAVSRLPASQSAWPISAIGSPCRGPALDVLPERASAWVQAAHIRGRPADQLGAPWLSIRIGVAYPAGSGRPRQASLPVS